jgi:transposase
MRPYSLDLRKRVVAAHDAREGSQPEIAARFRVSVSFVTRLLRRRRRTGSVTPAAHGGGHPPVLDRAAQRRLRWLVREQPDATLKQLAARVGVSCGRMTIYRTLRKLKITRKKKSLHASERDSRRVRRKRRAYREAVAGIDPRRLVFVDETRAHTAKTRTYGRAPRGQRVKGSDPGHWKSMTLISGLVPALRNLRNSIVKRSNAAPPGVDMVRGSSGHRPSFISYRLSTVGQRSAIVHRSRSEAVDGSGGVNGWAGQLPSCPGHPGPVNRPLRMRHSIIHK